MFVYFDRNALMGFIVSKQSFLDFLKVLGDMAGCSKRKGNYYQYLATTGPGNNAF